jgi:hypothetical protein
VKSQGQLPLFFLVLLLYKTLSFSLLVLVEEGLFLAQLPEMLIMDCLLLGPFHFLTLLGLLHSLPEDLALDNCLEAISLDFIIEAFFEIFSVLLL